MERTGSYSVCRSRGGEGAGRVTRELVFKMLKENCQMGDGAKSLELRGDVGDGPDIPTL